MLSCKREDWIIAGGILLKARMNLLKRVVGVCACVCCHADLGFQCSFCVINMCSTIIFFSSESICDL